MHLLTKLFGNQQAEPAAQPQNGHVPLDLSAREYSERFYRANVAHTLVDVRTPQEYAEGHLTAARNIPLQELEARMGEIPRERPVALYCRSGNRSGTAARMLHEAGYEDVYNIGGLSTLAAHHIPVDVPANR